MIGRRGLTRLEALMRKSIRASIGGGEGWTLSALQGKTSDFFRSPTCLISRANFGPGGILPFEAHGSRHAKLEDC